MIASVRMYEKSLFSCALLTLLLFIATREERLTDKTAKLRLQVCLSACGLCSSTIVWQAFLRSLTCFLWACFALWSVAHCCFQRQSASVPAVWCDVLLQYCYGIFVPQNLAIYVCHEFRFSACLLSASEGWSYWSFYGRSYDLRLSVTIFYMHKLVNTYHLLAAYYYLSFRKTKNCSKKSRSDYWLTLFEAVSHPGFYRRFFDLCTLHSKCIPFTQN